MKIRVLHLISNLRLGGAQTCLKQLVENNTDPDITQFIYPLRAQKVDIHIEGDVIELPYRNYDIRKFFAVLKICRQHNIDIIHAHLHKPVMGALLATFFCKAKVVVHEHGPIARRGIQYCFYRFMLRLLKKRAALFIAVSKAVCGQLIQHAGVNPARIEVVYNAVDLKAFTPNPEYRRTVREELGIPPDDVVIGFVGRLSYVKGPDILLDAFGLLLKKKNNCTLVFLGDGAMKSGLQSKAARLGINHRVKFPGFRKNVAEIMNAFDIGCMPSRQESFGIVALEMMSMKIPFVCSIPDGLAEIVTHLENALVPCQNAPLEIAECIERLTNNEDLRQSLVKNALASIRKFDMPQFVTRIDNIYQQIMKKQVD